MAGEEADVDWPAIRRDYEQTDASLRALAERWGFKSENTIRRRAKRDGWVRKSEEEIADGIAERVLSIEGRGVREDVRAAVRSEDAHTPAHMPPGQNPPTAGDRPRTVRTKEAESPPHVVDDRHAAHVRDPAELDAVGAEPQISLVDERARVVAKHLREARRGMATCTSFFDLLGAIATADLDGADMLEARTRLQALNLDKDSLSTLIKSMTGMFEAFVKIERQALGLDVGSGKAAPIAGTPDKPIDDGPVPQLVRQAFGDMTEEALMQLRGSLEKQIRARAPIKTIEGTTG